jgi:uncharacterized membrane protein
MTIAATALQSVAAAAKPWASLYSSVRAVSSTVTFLHLAGLLFAGGLAVSSDRATFRALRGTNEDRSRLLDDLGNAHAWVLGGLSVIFVSGLLLALSDVKTFGKSPIYWTKMSLVVLLLINGALLKRTEQKLRTGSLLIQSTERMRRLWARLRFTAATSMALWTAIVLAGVILVESS